MGIGSIGIPELIIILSVVFVFFGAKRLPTFARSLGEAIREFRNVGKQLEEDHEKYNRKSNWMDINISTDRYYFNMLN